MGPRRGMDGFARPVRPAGATNAPQPRPVAQPQPMARPMPPRPVQQQRPVQRPAGAYPVQQQQHGVDQQVQPQPVAGRRKGKRPKRSGGEGWKVFLQFVVGLLVIAGVAAAIVALYIRYYQ